MQRFFVLAMASMMVLVLAPWAFAPDGSVPHLINYQGMLTNDLGEPTEREQALLPETKTQQERMS